MRDKMGRLVAILLCALFTVGCGSSKQPTGEAVRPQSPVAVLHDIDEKDLAAFIESQRGKVVLVDYWATWCTSCVELFPHTVELHQRFADKGLAVVSVSFDDLDNRAGVLAFLQKNNAAFDNFIGVYGASGESLEKFGLPGPLPQLRLYDRAGRLQREFPQSQSSVNPDEIDAAVQKLLDGKS